jgi:hypothetical protein
VGPADDSNFTAEDLNRHAADLKKRILERAQSIAFAFVTTELIQKEISKKEKSARRTKKWSLFGANAAAAYAQRLVAKVLSNIEVKVCNIHIRYEDSLSIPNAVLSAGVTLDELFVVSTDENWVERSSISAAAKAKASPSATSHKRKMGLFSSTQQAPEASEDIQQLLEEPTVMFKVVTLRNLAAYWSPTSPTLATPIDDRRSKDSTCTWNETMQKMVFTEGNRCENVDYIISPPNLINVKIAHREDVVGGVLSKSKAAKAAANRDREVDTSMTGAGSGYSSPDDALADVTVDIEQLTLHLDATQLEQVQYMIYYRYIQI